MRYDLAVVGAGLSGAVIAERAARELSWRVLVVERREHVAGNAYDCLDQHGVRVHRYGPHVFHTNSEKVCAYLSRFTRWRPYQHRVRAAIEGRLVPVPFNLNSLARLFPASKARALREALLEQYGAGASVPVLRLRQSSNPLVRSLAEYVYEQVYLGYTLKQWGRRPEALDLSVTGRVPVRVSHDDRYFTDRFQAVPLRGYTALVQSMLHHPNIELIVNADFHDLEPGLRYARLVYTGPIDRYFEFRHGELPYRSLRFEYRHSPLRRIQRSGAITYPGPRAYTRSCECKILTGQRVAGTTITFEYPQVHAPGHTTPYYPMPAPESRTRYRLYAKDAERLRDVTFCGRLGSYQYLNMDQAVAQALVTFARLRARA